MTITLKYPEGEFTHAELAAFNGLEKSVVYLPMREAVARGILVLSGTRPTGKRPANLFRVATPSIGGQAASTEIIAPVPITAPLTPSPIVEPPSAPIIQPVVTVTPPAVPIRNLAPNPAYPCPLCKGPMTEIPDATGVMVKCFNEPCDPQCHENPYGYGINVKEAHKIACQKFIIP
jgi:hypothetical protein